MIRRLTWPALAGLLVGAAACGDAGNDGTSRATSTTIAVTTSSTIADTQSAPEPDPDATADDHPAFEWAFDRGYQEGSYGRADDYEPSSVSEPGSAAGLAAEEAYRAGFARGLADAVAGGGNRAAGDATDETGAADTYPVGEVLEGIDPFMAATGFWGFDNPVACDEAASGQLCADVSRRDNNSSVLALSLLDPDQEPVSALLLRPHTRGYEVMESWDAIDGESFPEWAEAQ